MNESTIHGYGIEGRGGQYWHGRYRGITFEVKAHKQRNAWSGGEWLAVCGYVHLDSRMFSAQEWAELSEHDNRVADNALDHPHGGLTYFAHSVIKNPYRGESYELLECGWDYSHLWDYERGRVAPVDALGDITTAVDALIARYPKMIVWSQKDGQRHLACKVAADDCAFTTLETTSADT